LALTILYVSGEGSKCGVDLVRRPQGAVLGRNDVQSGLEAMV